MVRRFRVCRTGLNIQLSHRCLIWARKNIRTMIIKVRERSGIVEGSSRSSATSETLSDSSDSGASKASKDKKELERYKFVWGDGERSSQDRSEEGCPSGTEELFCERAHFHPVGECCSSTGDDRCPHSRFQRPRQPCSTNRAHPLRKRDRHGDLWYVRVQSPDWPSCFWAGVRLRRLGWTSDARGFSIGWHHCSLRLLDSRRNRKPYYSEGQGRRQL